MYKKKERYFIDLCSNGEVLMDEIDDFIDEWHESAREIELHEFLGMSWNTIKDIHSLHLQKKFRRQKLSKLENLESQILR